MQYSNVYIESCLESSSSVFRELSPAEKELINKHHNCFSFKKGERVIEEGEKAKGLICLASGKLKVFRIGVGGREQIIKLVRQNGFVEYSNLFSENNYLFSSTALEDSSICILEKNTIIKILRQNTDLALKFIKLISGELSSANNRVVSLSQKHVRGRIAESLLVLKDTYGLEPDGKMLCSALSREDIAHLSNMTTSNAIRTLSNMAKEGLLKIEGRRITIIDLSELEKISQLG